jgi:RHH-type proline utilization regulon transcriptional repressor/proline dehydrogenase/delta 1-pyrroline-5-carboxylate dehydrogenase
MYAPVVAAHDFDASIAYLARRLDENTQPDNFLRALFTLEPDTAQFDDEAERFRRAVNERHDVATARRRGPQRHAPPEFGNAADSDWTDPTVRERVAAAIGRPPNPNVCHITGSDGIDRCVVLASEVFGSHDRAARRRWLLDAADLMETERVQSIALMVDEVSKTVSEADPEVSEAIDFCRYYAGAGSSELDHADHVGLRVDGRGVIVVVGPWNFPYAIPIGGVAAALVAGNSVILKPAPEAVAVGTWIAEQLWRSGVPPEVLQLVVCDDGPVGRHLVTHDDVAIVVLTGSYETAVRFLDWRPDRTVFAETSGKNALIVTPSADMDLAIADLARSAFGHAGQKCSAASLGILVGELYDDARFRRRLRDAVTSLRVGAASAPETMVGPLVQEPSGALERALTSLDAGEEWLVRPIRLDPGDDEGRMWTPGVRLGVRPGSWLHQTECFGPVLGMIRADDLDHAIAIQNGTDFGLTGGIHSLDRNEIEYWLDRVEVGNAYVNRHITGAIVQRQPFGGWKCSSVGGGHKAGGPHYVAQFARITPIRDADADELLRSFNDAWPHYRGEHDPTGLLSESNILRYRPFDRVAIRHRGGRGDALHVLRLAARTSGVAVDESDAAAEPDLAFAERVAGHVDGVRLLTTLDDEARRCLHRANVPIHEQPPVADGMIELARWGREQTVSRTTHRHGRLVE